MQRQYHGQQQLPHFESACLLWFSSAGQYAQLAEYLKDLNLWRPAYSLSWLIYAEPFIFLSTLLEALSVNLFKQQVGEREGSRL